MAKANGKGDASRISKAKVVPVEVVDDDAPGSGASTQPSDDDWNLYTPEGAITPPEDFDRLANLTQVSRTRRSCIAAIVNNTVGLGWTLEAIEGHEEEVKDDEIREAKAAIESYSRKDERLHRPNFIRQIKAVSWDRQEVGNGYIEISRNKVTGKVDGLFHVIGKRVRRNAKRDGWIVGNRGAPLAEQTPYYDFGQKVQYDDDGQPQGLLAKGATRWAINELIPFQIYTSESRDYGLPVDTQLVWDYLGDKRAGEANAAFFDGSGVPPTIIFVKAAPQSGTDSEGRIELEVDPRTAVAIADTLRTGSSLSRRVAVVPLPEGTEVQDVQLAMRADRDIGFVEYRKDNRRTTLGAFRVSPLFVADIEDTNYSTAEIERSVTKEQVFDPEQSEMEDILTATLLRDLGLDHLRFKFTEISIGKTDSADKLAEHPNQIQKGEYREAHGYGPLPERKPGDDDPADPNNDAEPDGKVPAGWNTEFVETPGGAAPPGGEPAPEPVDPNADEIDPATANIEDLAKSADGALFSESVEDSLHRVAQIVGPEFAMRPVIIEKEDGALVVKPYTSNGDGP